MEKTKAINNILEIQKLIPCFAVYGTALGIIREQDIISHDLDTDLGIMSSDFKWEYLTTLIKNGYEIHNIYGMRNIGLEISVKKDGIKTDLMIFYKKDGKITNSLWKNDCQSLDDQIIHEYEPIVFEIQNGNLAGHEVKTLGENYIKAVYGAEWRIPIEKWDWTKDHKCIKK